MKSLYVRVVLTFFVVTVLALLSALLTGLKLFETDLNDLQQSEMVTAGQNIIRLYQQANPQDLDAFLSGTDALVSYPVQIVAASGETKIYGAEKYADPVRISQNAIDRVLAGGRYQSVVKAEGAFVGLPFSSGDEHYALFLLPSSKNEAMIIRLILTFLLLTLVFGGLYILIAARYLVKPLKLMTQATKRLAARDFNVALKMKRKDEIGTLARSFNEMAQELKQMEHMRQEFVSNVSHEIQSPLTSISGFAKALMDDKLVTEDNRDKYLAIIHKESERLSRLSDNLLKLASLESDHHPFTLAAYHLDEQLRQVVLACEPLWSAKSISLELQLPSAAKITADPDQLNQVWMNVLGNSIKFTPNGGRILLAMSRTTNGYAVSITDSGKGIAPEDLPHIFERFYKTDRSRNQISGSGLGLAIVKKIVALHHGSIHAVSTIGHGTTITIQLPEKIS